MKALFLFLVDTLFILPPMHETTVHTPEDHNEEPLTNEISNQPGTHLYQKTSIEETTVTHPNKTVTTLKISVPDLHYCRYQVYLPCIYTPNSHQIRFLNKAIKKINRQGSLILYGDFNIIPDQALDTSNPSPRHPSHMLNFVQFYDLHDMWRCLHTTDKDYTYFSAPHNLYSQINYFLVDKWVLQKIHNSTIDPITWLEHAPMGITITPSTFSNPTRIWRANTHIMQTSPYAEQIQNHLTDLFLNNQGSVPYSSTLWMAHKAFMRGILIQLSSLAKKRRRQGLDELTTEISNINTQKKLKPTHDLKKKYC